MVVDKTKVRLQIWDTAGQERFRSMTPIYYRGAHAAIIVYDITNLESFLQVKLWLKELIENLNQNILIAVVGSKSDLSDHQRKVNFIEAKDLIKVWTQEHCQNFFEFLPSSLKSNDSLNFIDNDHQFNNNNATNTISNVNNGNNRSRSRSTSSSIIRSFSNISGDDISNNNNSTSSFIDEITLLEVSAKDDCGIEDLFLWITRKLVASKVRITKEQANRARESIFLTSSMGDGSIMSDSNLGQSSTSMSRSPSNGSNSWSCC